MMVLLYSKILVSIIALGSPSALPSPPKKKKKFTPKKPKEIPYFFGNGTF